MIQIFSNSSSTENIFSVCECLDAVATVKESFTQSAYKQICYCMYLVINWEADIDEELSENLDDLKVGVGDSTTKCGIVKDGFNNQ